MSYVMSSMVYVMCNLAHIRAYVVTFSEMYAAMYKAYSM